MSTAVRTPDIASLRWKTWGTSVVLRVTAPAMLARARLILERHLDEIDRTCSRFRHDSDLSRVNARAGRVVEIDPLLVSALQIALRAAALTDGDVDPTLGAALVLAGYDRDWSLMREHDTRGQDSPASQWPPRPAVLARTLTGWRTVELDSERHLVRIPVGMALDLGATAKAWAADRAARALSEELGCGILVSLGGDVAVAGAAPEGGWRIHVTDDHRSAISAEGQTISIEAGGLATSSVVTRSWRREGVAMHHIIDPASGTPARGRWRTVSVAAADCTDANIASTAAIVRDESALQWLANLGLPARLVEHDGAIHTVGTWPAEGRP